MKSLRRRRSASDAGLSLVELLVAIVLTGVLGGVVVTVLLGIHASVTNTTAQHNLNEEARLALNRIAREVRQATAITTPSGFTSASAITSVRNPDGADYDATQVTTVTFTSDFNGDGCIDGVNSAGGSTGCTAYNVNDPETLTYCWDPSSDVRELFLIPGQFVGPTCQTSGAQAILAGDVTSFKLSYRSNSYLADADNDGITTWTELDARPSLGNGDGQLDSAELPEIDSVVIDITASEGGNHSQSYTTEVDLRNVS